jgi:hypothetical protein
MPREPANTAQIKLRLSAHLRAKLTAEAERNRIPLNHEATRRLEASFDARPHATFAAAAQSLDILITQIEVAWARLEATREFLVLVDLITTKIIDRGERDEGVKDLVWPARELRRLRATVDQPLREPGPGVRLQGENK